MKLYRPFSAAASLRVVKWRLVCFCSLLTFCLDAQVASAELETQGETVVDVVPTGFTAVWQVNAPADPQIQIFSDAQGTVDITSLWQIQPWSLWESDAFADDADSRSRFRRLTAQSRELGLLSLRATGDFPGETVYFRLLSSGDGQTVAWPATELTSVSLPLDTAFVAYPLTIALAIPAGADDGAVLFAMIDDSQAGTVAVVGDGGYSDQVILQLSNLRLADGSSWSAIEPSTITFSWWKGFADVDSRTATVNIVEEFAVSNLLELALWQESNQSPQAVTDIVSVNEDQTLVLDVLANDVDPDGTVLELVEATEGAAGVVEIQGQQLVYTPTDNFFGQDSFTYTIADLEGATAVGQVTVTVLPINDPPIAVGDSVSTHENSPIWIDALANDLDVDGDGLDLVEVSAASYGSVDITSSLVLYTPLPYFSGVDVFTYGISDGEFTSSGTIQVLVISLDNDEDNDDDGIVDFLDNCPLEYNSDQTDTDADSVGDACDDDDDGDLVVDANDNCPLISNADQVDLDDDSFGSSCDCNDTSTSIHPGSVDTCNAQDDDCDGVVDENPEVNQHALGYDSATDTLLEVNPTDGTVSSYAGPFSTDAGDVNALSLSSATGQIFLHAKSTHTIYEALIPTQTLTAVATAPANTCGLAQDDEGQLFALTSDDTLYTIDAASGTVTLLGNVGFNIRSCGLAYSVLHRTLYASSTRSSGPEDYILALDRVTAEAFVLVQLDSSIDWTTSGIAYDDESDRPYVLTESGLYSVDLANGLATLVSTDLPGSTIDFYGNNGQRWYADADGDGLGDSSNSLVACAEPTGYVQNGGDCYDGSDTIGGEVGWFQDSDEDGFGNSDIEIRQRDAPAGYSSEGNDCNDNDNAIHPTASESCDGVDNDCDGLVDDADTDIVGLSERYSDGDSDGFGDPLQPILACAGSSGSADNGGDCNDSDSSIHPGASEVCNELDDDCDTLIDDSDPDVGGMVTWYADADGDGFGDDSSVATYCTQPLGMVADDSDCNDSDATVNPEGTEVCDGQDNDCDYLVDDEDREEDVITSEFAADLEGWTLNGSGGTVAWSSSGGNPGGYARFMDSSSGRPYLKAPSALLGDWLSGNGCGSVSFDHRIFPESGSGTTNAYEVRISGSSGDSATWTGSTAVAGSWTEVTVPLQPSAWKVTGNWDNLLTNVSSLEIRIELLSQSSGNDIEGIDNVILTLSCSDPLPGAITWYDDADQDGFGNPDQSDLACSQLDGTVSDGTDCDDTDPASNPAAQEWCDGVDNDCDGLADDADSESAGQSIWYADSDVDGYGGSAFTLSACLQPSGYKADSDDCDDEDANIHPGAEEVCDALDNDCDGLVDDEDEPPPAVGIRSAFDQSLDGWTQSGSGGTTSWSGSGGNPSGYAKFTDSSSGRPYLKAPSTFLGSWTSGNSCGSLSFDHTILAGSGTGTYNSYEVKLTGSNGSTATWKGSASVPGSWQTVAVPLTASAWTVSGSWSGLLAGVSALEIRFELLGQSSGSDTEGIDNVVLLLTCGSEMQGSSSWYHDGDIDGYGDPLNSTLSCAPPETYTADNTDCNDTNSSIYPSAVEVQDGLDNDCDGVVDEQEP